MKEIALYQIAERIKSELIIASKLAQTFSTISDKEGAKEIMESFFSALLAETRIAHNVTGAKGFLDAEMYVMECAGRLMVGDKDTKCIAKAISAVTTIAQEASKKLMEKGLL